jgi:hypothetical protein
MQVDVEINLAFGTAKNVQIGSSPGGTGEPSPNTTVNTRRTAQLSSSTLSTRKIGDWQLVRLEDGANASNGVPAFVYKIKGRVFATAAVLCAPKNGISQPEPHVELEQSCSSLMNFTTSTTQ